MRSICCILGAGYSHAAGVPLTKELFSMQDVAIPSEAAKRRFCAVWSDYKAWLTEDPSRNAEEYLAELLLQQHSVSWTLNKAYALARAPSGTAEATAAQCATLSFPDFPVPARAVPPFEWAVELVGAALATPLPSDRMATNFRYGARVTFPFQSTPHSAFWRQITAKADHVAVVTTRAF